MTHPLQSGDWEKARKQMGIEIVRLDGYLISLHKIPLTNYKIGYLPRSVFPNKDSLSFLLKYGQENKIIFFKIEPYVEKFTLPPIPYTLRPSPHPLFPSWTQVLELNKTEEELLKSFHSKTRYNIRLAERKSVVVKEMSNNEGFETFIKLYFETTKRQKYFGHNYRYHKVVWENFKNKIAHILVAYYNNVPLAAYELWYLNGIIYYVYGGTSEHFRNLMPSNLLMWEAIKLGKKLGAEKFDMWGSLGPNYDPKDPWAGFTKFKEGYGTKFVEFAGSYDLIINPLLYKMYNLIYTLRDTYLKLKAHFN